MRLRHTVVTMLYRAGATIPEIAAIIGHTIGSLSSIIEKYGLRDKETAGNAIQKRLDREGREHVTQDRDLRSLAQRMAGTCYVVSPRETVDVAFLDRKLFRARLKLAAFKARDGRNTIPLLRTR